MGAPLPLAPEMTRPQSAAFRRMPVPIESVESKLPRTLSVSNVKAWAALPISVRTARLSALRAGMQILFMLSSPGVRINAR